MMSDWSRKEAFLWSAVQYVSWACSTKAVWQQLKPFSVFGENTHLDSSFHSSKMEEMCALITLLCLLLPIVLPIPFFQLLNLLQQQIRFEGELLGKRKKRKHYEPKGVNRLFLARSDTFEDLYPSTDLINVKTCKNSVLRHSVRTILSRQLFGIMPWQIQYI